MNLHLDWCTHTAAKYACEHWHYSKTIPCGKIIKIGVWENEKYIGCVLFSRGSNPNLGKEYNLKQIEVCELTRIALTKHETPVTKIIKVAFLFLKKCSPKTKLVISYADINQGHEGKIYFASNWKYEGIIKSTDQYFYNGKWNHQRSAGDKFGKCRHIPKEIPRRKIKGKHKFIYPIDKQWYAQFCASGETSSHSTPVEG